MDSNTHSTSHPTGTPTRFAAVVAELQGLPDQDPASLADHALSQRITTLRGLMDRLEGPLLADLDARGAAAAEDGVPVGSTAGWLRTRLRMSASAAASCVRTARALYRGPLTATGQALAAGSISPAHAQVLAADTHDLPDHLAAEAEPVLLDAARRLDSPQLRRAVAHLRLVADPDPDHPTRPSGASSGGGCGWPPPGKAWSPSTGCWTRRPARRCLLPWSPGPPGQRRAQRVPASG
jgi:Domain of unknown function (DUF222)